MLNLSHPHIVCLFWEQGIFLRTNAVLQSQALGQMKFLHSLGANITIICSDPSSSEFEKTCLHKFEAEGLSVIPIRQMRFLGITSFFTLRLFRKHLHALNQKGPIDFIYIRNFWNILAVPDRRLKVVFDLRGANRDETEFNKGKKQILFRIKNNIYAYFERNAIKRANYLQCVSHPLKDYIAKNFQRDDVHVISSCFEKTRFENCHQRRNKIRATFGINPDDIVFLYSGGLAKYQELDFMLALWARISQVLENSYFLLFSGIDYTNIRGNVPLQEIPADRIRIQSIAYEEIPGHLVAADFGFLLRQNITVNRVASPVKFAEYLAVGLGIITSSNIGDISGFVKQHSIGCLVNVGDLENGIREIMKLVNRVKSEGFTFSTRVQELAHQRFTWEAHKEYFLKRYFGME